MSELALRILAEFRSLPANEQRELAAAVLAEVRDTDARLRLLEEITSRYHSEEPQVNLDDAWADSILASKRTG